MTAHPAHLREESRAAGPLLPVIETRPAIVRRHRLRLLWALFFHILRLAGNPLRAIGWTRALLGKYHTVHGAEISSKMAHVEGRMFWRIGAPGFPSAALSRNWDSELARICEAPTTIGLRNVYFAITTKCPYRCEHCFEWDNLNRPETLSREDIIHIVDKFQRYGAAQIIFSGGEPLLRIKDILAVLENARPDSDFWIISSGFSLTTETARQLKAAGLTGIAVSLDHWQPDAHDRFRHYPGAFDIAVQAVEYARAAGLVTAFSLCATREFCTSENMIRYMELARGCSVSFVQILEPVAAGHFAGKDVLLHREHIQVLESFYLQYNQHRAYRSYPIVDYQGYIQRRLGCFGAANRFMYVDPKGYAHRCPFCREPLAKVLEFPIKDIVALVREQGCVPFEGSAL